MYKTVQPNHHGTNVQPICKYLLDDNNTLKSQIKYTVIIVIFFFLTIIDNLECIDYFFLKEKKSASYEFFCGIFTTTFFTSR